MKKRKIALFLLFLLCACILLYPSLASIWNSYHAVKEAEMYESMIQKIPQSQMEESRKQANQYNQSLLEGNTALAYEDMLNLSDAMATLEIPGIDLKLGIYHGTSEETLQKKIGHLEGTSLPVGGKGTHCVLTGHSGLPGVPLFTDLTKLEEGNLFLIHVFDETLIYEIDQIKVVEPDDLSDLAIDPNADQVTLITCTPYGVNDHRLLVRGTRITSNETQIQKEKAVKTNHSMAEVMEWITGFFAFFLSMKIIFLMKKA